tara:strand:- start:605 stop:946 length:342 start_codon:yes stop_codon:yes gene_type:complete
MKGMRRSYRLPVSDVASLQLRLPEILGALPLRVLNISKAGIKFEMIEGLEFVLGENVMLKLSLNNNVSLRLQAEIRRIDDDGFAAEFLKSAGRSLEGVEHLCSFLEIAFEQKG